jgi:RNA 3'-terminal phosphate cyclase
LLTNIWVIERFGIARISVEGAEGAPGDVTVTPAE